MTDTISMPPTTAIPPALLALLSTFWEGDAERLFDRDWAGATHADRAHPPIHTYPDPRAFHAFEVDEIAALSRLPLFSGVIAADGAALKINAHAENALVDFCRDTYAAYAKLHQRIAAVSAARTVPSGKAGAE